MFRLIPSRRSFPALALVLGLVAAAPAIAEDKDPFTHFGTLTKDATHKSGFFDIYEKREKVYLEIPMARLGEPFLLVQSLSKGIGMNGFLGGMPTTIFDGAMVQFERKGDHIHLVQLNHRFRAPEGSAEARAVDLSFGNSVLASLKIESERHEGDEIGKEPEKPKKDDDKDKKDGDKKDGDDQKDEAKEEEDEKKDEPKKPVTSVVIDFGKILISDTPNLTQALNDGDGLIVAKTEGQYRLDDERSSVNSIKVFPQNAEFNVDLVFTSSKDPFMVSVIDSRYVTLGLHSSFSALPKEPMRPRYADPRAGYFMTVYKDFALDHEKEFFVRYINRWRLEKEDPGAAMSKPKKQIVYYVENTIPPEYRKYVKEGIEMWQKAYEAAGFKDAIVAKDQPDDPDWAAEDVRYSTIRWITSHEPSFGAIGPSRTDPRTGEILDADILVEANMIQGFRNNWQRLVAPKGTTNGADPFEYAIEADRIAWDQAMAKGGPEAARRSCAAAQSLAMTGAFLNMALAARGDIAPGQPVPEEYLGEAIRWVIAHEVGHTLGLEHNFKSSTSCPYARLHDKVWVKEHGLYGSVMEYPSVNFASVAAQQGYYYSPVVGTWDDWIIRYGYSEFKDAKTPDDEKAALAQIAGESSDPLHAYGTSENYYPIGAVDAFVNAYDMSDDPMAFARERTNQITALFNGLDQRLMTNGDSWDNLTNGFSILLGNYYQSMSYVSRYVGGMETSRSVKGELNGDMPMKMLPAAKQREAVTFLRDNLFSDKPFDLPEGFIEKLGPNRWGHWGSNFMPAGREDFPFYNRILAMERPIINRITHPITLQRLVDAELYDPNAFTLVELFDTMGNAMWSEVSSPAAAGPAKISTIRRGGQRLWLDRLINIAFTPDQGTPDDARAVARVNLMDLQKKIGAALESGAAMDGLTKAHLLDCQARVATALEAGYQLEVMGKKS